MDTTQDFGLLFLHHSRIMEYGILHPYEFLELDRAFSIFHMVVIGMYVRRSIYVNNLHRDRRHRPRYPVINRITIMNYEYMNYVAVRM